MRKALAALAIVALLAVVFISGCTQQSTTDTTTGGTMGQTREEAASATIETELDQAIANMSEDDLEEDLLLEA